MTIIIPGPTERALQEVAVERATQDAKWGEQNHPNGTGPDLPILRLTDVNLDLRTGEELAGIFRRRTDDRAKCGRLSYMDILLEEVFEATAEADVTHLRTELIQVAAVAVAWVEKIDRQST